MSSMFQPGLLPRRPGGPLGGRRMTGSAETSLGLKWTVSFELLLGDKIREGAQGEGGRLAEG